jgi:hypothetical protein
MSPDFDAGTPGIAHHIIDGPHTFPYAIDAHQAVSRFPQEWSHEPWIRDDERVFDMIIIVGADKGGVGKTTISRTLMDYFKAQGAEYRAFDTEAPLGVLKRFYPDKTEVVDLTKSDGQMTVFDTLKNAPITVIDVRAGLLSPTLKTLAEIGFLDASKLKIVVLHVIGATKASFAEIKATRDAVGGSKHFLVTNHTNESDFFSWDGDTAKQALAIGDGLIDIPKLNELAMEHVETLGVPFQTFIDGENNSPVLRGYVRHWLSRVFQQFDAAKLNQGAEGFLQ